MAIMWDSLIPPTALTAFARSVPTDQNYILNQILPDRYDMTLHVDFAESVVTTRAASARAWDAPPQPGVRDSFKTSRVKLPAISQFMSRGERDRLELERQVVGGSAFSAIEQAIFNDTEANVRSVQARVELMRGDVLADGKVTLTELGGIEADFGVPSGNLVTAATLWSTTGSADPLGDIRGWAKAYRLLNGFAPGGMVMSEDTLYSLLQNTTIRQLWSNAVGSPRVVTLEQLNQTFGSERLPQIKFTYDAQTVVGNTATYILPQNKVIFLPPDGIELGFTQWGMSATALELSNADVQLAPSPAGIVAVVDKDVTPPYRESVYVDATCMPVITRPNALMVATVA